MVLARWETNTPKRSGESAPIDSRRFDKIRKMRKSKLHIFMFLVFLRKAPGHLNHLPSAKMILGDPQLPPKCFTTPAGGPLGVPRIKTQLSKPGRQNPAAKKLGLWEVPKDYQGSHKRSLEGPEDPLASLGWPRDSFGAPMDRLGPTGTPLRSLGTPGTPLGSPGGGRVSLGGPANPLGPWGGGIFDSTCPSVIQHQA